MSPITRHDRDRTASANAGAPLARELSLRQRAVLQGVVRAYLGDAGPIGSELLAHLLPVKVSSATIRNTLAELAELGLVGKPHASSGRVPTSSGLRLFVDELMRGAPASELDAFPRRAIEQGVQGADAEGVARIASHLLSRHTRQLGFVVPPSLDRVVLRHVSLVRLASDRVLAVFVSEAGVAHRRVVESRRAATQPELDRMASLLRERVAGRTLREVRERIRAEARELRGHADALLARALEIGTEMSNAEARETARDLVIETRLALLEQPEFRDPRRLRDLFEALETKEQLLAVLDELLSREGTYAGEGAAATQSVHVLLGEEAASAGLRDCALVVSRYGDERDPSGLLGVIGPSRMNYPFVIPFVDYLSQVVSHKLSA
jgi:heat-inducible transcriptional repressor